MIINNVVAAENGQGTRSRECHIFPYCICGHETERSVQQFTIYKSTKMHFRIPAFYAPQRLNE